MELYHFRSVDNAIYEIRDNTLHFASPKEVNDPIDGYAGIYWRGDYAAWEGLLRNYVCSLYHAIGLYRLGAEQNFLLSKSVLVDIHCFDELPLGDILRTVGDSFLQQSSIRKVVERYGNSDKDCYAKELKSILNLVHGTAMCVCLDDMYSRDLLPKKEYESIYPTISNNEEQIWSLSDGMDSNHTEKIFTMMGEFTDDIYEIGHINIALKEKTEERKNPDTGESDYSMRQKWLSIYIDFPAIYVRKLQDMIFPQGYIACFSANKENSVMWGNYADHHRGVCLIYEPQMHENRHVIPLGQDGCYSKHEVRKMEYDGTPILRNFFDSLGRMTGRALRGWLTGTKETSIYHAKYYDDEQ